MAVVSDYQSFKDYLITFLWKKGDQVLIDNLDNLIRQGEASINRELREEQRHAATDLTISAQDMPLPSDYYSMRQVSDATGQLGEFQYVTPAELKGRRQRSYSNTMWPIYSLEDTTILFSGPTTTDNPTVTDNVVSIDYVRKAPQFMDTDVSWLTTDNLDLLTYATLYHTAPFLREDERVQLWQGMYKDIIMTLNEQSAHEKQRGVYGMTPLPRKASGYVRKGVRKQSSFKLATRP